MCFKACNNILKCLFFLFFLFVSLAFMCFKACNNILKCLLVFFLFGYHVLQSLLSIFCVFFSFCLATMCFKACNNILKCLLVSFCLATMCFKACNNILKCLLVFFLFGYPCASKPVTIFLNLSFGFLSVWLPCASKPVTIFLKSLSFGFQKPFCLVFFLFGYHVLQSLVFLVFFLFGYHVLKACNNILKCLLVFFLWLPCASMTVTIKCLLVNNILPVTIFWCLFFFLFGYHVLQSLVFFSFCLATMCFKACNNILKCLLVFFLCFKACNNIFSVFWFFSFCLATMCFKALSFGFLSVWLPCASKPVTIFFKCLLVFLSVYLPCAKACLTISFLSLATMCFKSLLFLFCLATMCFKACNNILNVFFSFCFGYHVFQACNNISLKPVFKACNNILKCLWFSFCLAAMCFKAFFFLFGYHLLKCLLVSFCLCFQSLFLSVGYHVLQKACNNILKVSLVFFLFGYHIASKPVTIFLSVFFSFCLATMCFKACNNILKCLFGFSFLFGCHMLPSL
ncbi:unnamed protein product [Acanthosepion pharaonis]|uniref:Uncharacterized protein n=1 Tax=Acanthosepion pharaonis TaxID=158019 RepID=A0A812AWC3_ACAPH|nr:unnamed protein product [Sepia pharaonis]